MAQAAQPHSMTGPVFGPVRKLITAWALMGGVLLLAVVVMNTLSVAGSVAIAKPFPGDFEMTEIGVCVAAFSFLPYCQMTRSDVSADIFTSRASDLWIGIFSLAASVVALGFGLLLMWRMYAGMLDQKTYNYTTAILQFPHWVAFVPILISLALLALAAVMRIAECIQDIRKA